MKKLILSAILVGSMATTFAQTADSVEIGAGYANQVWYSMLTGKQATVAKDNWDLAFDMVEIYATIRINSESGVMLWNYPKGDKGAWSTVDTNGLSTWTARYNSDTSWTYGAMGAYSDPSDPFDLDWGKYDVSTHTIKGDSLYVIKLVNGDYKKLFIEKLLSGVYTFKFANLDGSNETTASIDKSNFASRNFAYFSIVDNKSLNREPDFTKWDILFTQYTSFVPTAYNVTGVLHNRGARTVQVDNIPNVSTYMNWQSHNDNSEINTIGYDWKSFNGTGYDIKDSLVYFVKTWDKEIGEYSVWKLWFTDFQSATGKYVFNKQTVYTASVAGVDGKTEALMTLYPNPSNGSNVTLVYDINTGAKEATVQVYDMTGRLMLNDRLQTAAGMYTYTIHTAQLQSGLYIVRLTVDGKDAVQRLSIN
ncbi:MAG: T9SS type A sorting domain-containing protein [Chitinophagales bacterium]|nr:T9SS type A sorting domain-containing protein [Chitinophagaceae bacterium]MCB9065974.1 T9SS type A sorting domain-containing protein [Chitinophagales bacterium]